MNQKEKNEIIKSLNAILIETEWLKTHLMEESEEEKLIDEIFLNYKKHIINKKSKRVRIDANKRR